jgi:uncharacterized protein YggU (UPF0235/DUF167 family)
MTELRVRVKPNARVAELVREEDGTYLARVKAAPVEGKANEALVALIAETFGVRKAQISIRRGAASRIKLVVIDD